MQQIRKRADLVAALDWLAARDADLARAYQLVGAPDLRKSKGGFQALVSLLISQQVSIAAARAIEGRLYDALPELTPETFLSLDIADLRKIGLSAQKINYLTNLAQAILAGALKLRGLSRLADDEVRTKLIALKGIGAWTAENYLMFTLKRADVFPSGDLALQEGFRQLMRHKARPNPQQLDAHAQKWQPYRAPAALLIWRYYRYCKDNPTDPRIA